MVLSPKRRRGTRHTAEAAAEEIAPIQFRLEAAQDVHVRDDGTNLDGRGYTICDPRTGKALGEDDFFFRIGGGMVADLLGTERHLDNLQDAAFGPGRSLALVRHPVVSGDEPPVVEVFDLARTRKVGELPPDIADAIAFHGADAYEAAFCLWEWRDSDGQRVGLRVLLAPGWAVEELPERSAV
jgi:hypothetical protein